MYHKEELAKIAGRSVLQAQDGVISDEIYEKLI